MARSAPRRSVGGSGEPTGLVATSWRTCGKIKKFVVSFLTDKDRGSVQNINVPNNEGKRKYSSLSEASVVMERLILSSDKWIIF